MKPILHVALLAATLCAGPEWGEAGEWLRPTLDVNDMRLVVSYVSTDELVKLQRQYGVRTDARDLRKDHHHGFSILRTNRTTGARTCEIYVPEEKRPSRMDDEGTLIIGHELLHCMLGDYHS